ncbi:Espin-like protein [Pteropus alecto]|uniref:Espin-like protein n=1 Tax=Pteropus alecto TaxID=9402 RepID=L5KSG3_PTEAL|nr:Espin-like protein [Pteropus alecto]
MEQRALSAAMDGDLAALEQLLEAGALGPGIIDALGAGLVHHATRAGHLACVKFLVQRAKLPGNQRAHNGATPVHDAAATGSLAELCWLVREGGCGLQDQDASGVSPLHLAARFAHPVLVEWLLREGHAATLETLEGALPLHHAAVSGDLTCLKLLTAAHGSPRPSLLLPQVTFTDISLTARDNEGATALHFAARGGHTPILDRLLLMGAPVTRDSWGGTPLHDAAENGQMECCQALVSHRVDHSLRDGDGNTAADLAEDHGHQDCAQYLREAARQWLQQPPTDSPDSFGSLCLQPSRCSRRAFRAGRPADAPPSPVHCVLGSWALGTDSRKVRAAASLSPVWPDLPDPPLPMERMTHAIPPGATASATAVLTGAETAVEDTRDGLAVLQLDGLPPGDLDGLVPTQDERGQLIPEWKRQVMVRKLQALLGADPAPEDQAVTDEVACGRRAWADGFEDIKARFFGSGGSPAEDTEPGHDSGHSVPSPVMWTPPSGSPPQAAAPSRHPEAEAAAEHLGPGSPPVNFNSEDICGYIDRSFAFWKEKEAEMFSFGD